MKTTLNKNRKMNSKKLMIALMLLAAPLFTFSQATFDKFEDMDDVSVVNVNKRAFDLLKKVSVSGESKEAQEYIDMVGNLDNLRVLATENASIAAKMKAEVTKYLKSSKLSELMRVKDKEGNVRIYIKEGKDADHVSELFMFVQGLNNVGGDRKPEAVIVSITGNIDLNKISELTKQMDIPGGEHLKKAKKNK